MRHIIALALIVLGCSGGSSPGPSGGCRTGCPCGRSCISCTDRCHMGTPEEGATVVGTVEALEADAAVGD